MVGVTSVLIEVKTGAHTLQGNFGVIWTPVSLITLKNIYFALLANAYFTLVTLQLWYLNHAANQTGIKLAGNFGA